MLDLTNVPEESFPILEPGLYPFMATEVEIKKSQGGHDYLNLRLQCTAPDQPSANVFDIISLWHPDEKVKGMAMSRLKGFLVSAGFKDFRFQDKHDLISKIKGAHVWGNVKIEKSEGYADKNKVTFYQKVDKSVDLNQDFKNAQGGTSSDIPF